MTKTKWVLILLGVMDLVLIIFHLTDYFILFLKPTGYLVPLGINIIVLSVIGFCSSFPKIWIIIGIFVSIPVILFNGLTVLILDNDYIKINSPHNQQSLVIEYRHASLGETTYFYNFYKTKFGLIGKYLNEQSIEIMIPGTEHPSGLGAEDVLGLGMEKWITANAVRFITWQGMKDVYLNSSHPLIDSDDSKGDFENIEKSIEKFIKKVTNKEDGEVITINGNSFSTRYDESSGQSWIEIGNENDKGAIPRQQCSRIVPNEERGYYMLEECTHKWEYPLYPMAGSR
ncbi:hypothetical protein JOC75_001023 [Metabacillus crassostreae]|uniref:hypothetical protein n=1 Tax=Metabacillus crassostreae TaxID=929098 RepID=UPI00195AB0BA|nr:hypothetical protein [Metabacillus crassostreae]MBM7603053.1 hypothetical protein [Metabacillus crassostreae]